MERPKTVKGSDKGSNRKKEVQNLTVSDFSVAAGEGFEPSEKSAKMLIYQWSFSLVAVLVAVFEFE